MEAVIDQADRIVLPKPIRDALGLLPGTRVDISAYGAGAQRREPARDGCYLPRSDPANRGYAESSIWRALHFEAEFAANEPVA